MKRQDRHQNKGKEMTKKGASNGAAETAAQALSNAPELSIDEALWQIAGDLLSNFQEGSNQSDAPEDPRQDGSDDPALTSSMGGSLLQKNTLELLKNQSLNRDQLVAILKAKIGTSFESAGAPEMAETKEDEEVVLEKSRVILHPSGKKVVSAGLMEKLSKLVQKDQPKVLSAALLDLIGSERTEDWRSHEALLRQLLHEACRCDAVHVAEMLLDCSRFPAVSIDDCDERRRTALHHAAECHSLECIELLIKRRAKVDLEDDTGCTPLESAMQSLR